jgi:isoleucyl-tRNA synthetase
LSAINKALGAIDEKIMAPIRRGESVTLSIDGTSYLLAPEDVLVSTQQAADWVAADERGVQVALSMVITPELVREGLARDFVRQVQQMRKEADLEISDRIRIDYNTGDAAIAAALGEWNEYIRAETLADALSSAKTPPAGAKQVLVGETEVWLKIDKS